jgi:hypothetical protein
MIHRSHGYTDRPVEPYLPDQDPTLFGQRVVGPARLGHTLRRRATTIDLQSLARVDEAAVGHYQLRDLLETPRRERAVRVLTADTP